MALIITIHTISPPGFNLCLPSNWEHPGKSEPALHPLRMLRPLPCPQGMNPSLQWSSGDFTVTSHPAPHSPQFQLSSFSLTLPALSNSHPRPLAHAPPSAWEDLLLNQQALALTSFRSLLQISTFLTISGKLKIQFRRLSSFSCSVYAHKLNTSS